MYEQIESEMSGPKCFFDISIGGKESRIGSIVFIVVGRIVMQLYAVRVDFSCLYIGCSKNCGKLPVFIGDVVYCQSALHRGERNGNEW